MPFSSKIKKFLDCFCFSDELYKSEVLNRTSSIVISENDDSSLPLVVNQHINDSELIKNAGGGECAIYYISDMHIDHKLVDIFHNSGNTKKLKEYFSSIIDQYFSFWHYYIHPIICGDSFSSFEISKIFYSILIERKFEAFIILGNHEYWSFNSYEEAVKAYRKLFDGSKLTLLQNDLYINSSPNAYKKIIPFKDLGSMSEKDIQNTVGSADFLIFGATGFAGQNCDFNATKGIYQQCISRDRELQLAKESELIYNKLVSALPLTTIIFASHNPIKQWAKPHYADNFYYISGHTHKNHFDLSRNIYADNQIGYRSQNYSFYSFFLHKQYIDSFRYYPDGIHTITLDQYKSSGLVSWSTITKSLQNGYNFYLLKNSGYKLFLVKKESNGLLYLLDGGKHLKLKIQDVNYYYDNMVKFASAVSNSSQWISTVLSSVSERIRKIGGVGKVHGCIVDIDFWNHIKFDPETRDFTYYYATSTSKLDRIEYDSLIELVASNCPRELYDNLVGLQKKGESMLPVVSENKSVLMKDESFYKQSMIMNKIQHLSDHNIIRLWDDSIIDILNKNRRLN